MKYLPINKESLYGFSESFKSNSYSSGSQILLIVPDCNSLNSELIFKRSSKIIIIHILLYQMVT